MQGRRITGWYRDTRRRIFSLDRHRYLRAILKLPRHAILCGYQICIFVILLSCIVSPDKFLKRVYVTVWIIGALELAEVLKESTLVLRVIDPLNSKSPQPVVVCERLVKIDAK